MFPYSVDLEVRSKLAHDFEYDLERINAFSNCDILTRALLPQIISYSDTKMLVLILMEYKRTNVIMCTS